MLRRINKRNKQVIIDILYIKTLTLSIIDIRYLTSGLEITMPKEDNLEQNPRLRKGKKINYHLGAFNYNDFY